MKFPTLTLIAALLLSACATTASRADVTEPFVQSYPFTEKGAILLDSVNGPVEIETWDKNEVSVDVMKSAPTADDLARVHVKIESTPERISIGSEYDKKWYLVGSWRGEVRYKIHVPVHATLEKISVINGDITLRDAQGSVSLKTLNGRINASGIAAKGHFETVNGGITVAYTQLAGVDAITIQTVNGQCELTLPKGAAFSLNSKSVNGGVRTDAALKIEKTGLGRFAGRTGEGGPAITFNSVNGALAIREQP